MIDHGFLFSAVYRIPLELSMPRRACLAIDVLQHLIGICFTRQPRIPNGNIQAITEVARANLKGRSWPGTAGHERPLRRSETRKNHSRAPARSGEIQRAAKGRKLCLSVNRSAHTGIQFGQQHVWARSVSPSPDNPDTKKERPVAQRGAIHCRGRFSIRLRP